MGMDMRIRRARPRWKIHYDGSGKGPVCGMELWKQMTNNFGYITCKNCLRKLKLRK